MALKADAAGVIKGKFTIPANVSAGTKNFTLLGAGGSRGDATFVGQGTLVTQVLQSITRVTTSVSLDPLAQTFTLSSEAQVGAVELHIAAKGTSPIIVQIRETQVGFPTGTILAEGRLAPADVKVGQWNRFLLDSPIHVMANSELAIVVLCNDAQGALSVAELGKFDQANQKWVTNQPYQVGVLLSSSNASTWTAHQDKDMCFRLLARRYSASSKEVSLGTVAVTNATDLVVMSMAENAATAADSDIVLTMPDGSTVSAGDGQNIRLSNAVTGNIGVKARLRANQATSAVLRPGTQVASGTVQASGSYISRAIDADAAGANIRITLNADLPSGSSLVVSVSGTDAGDTWLAVSQVGTPKALGDGIYEYQFLYSNLKKARVRVKLDMTGTAAARPRIFNLRVSTVTAT